MPQTASPRPRRKRPAHYHHGDLRRALLEEAIRTIQRHGVAALTLRAIGERLGVSRAALYRHFADKSALLAAVAADGFRRLRQALLDSWKPGEQNPSAFAEMGVAYVRFAHAHPAHYRVMFGGFTELGDGDAASEGAATFQVLVDALALLQQQGSIRSEEVLMQARFVWAVVHGVAMLAIDGRLHCTPEEVEPFARYAAERVRTGIGT